MIKYTFDFWFRIARGGEDIEKDCDQDSFIAKNQIEAEKMLFEKHNRPNRRIFQVTLKEETPVILGTTMTKDFLYLITNPALNQI